MCFVVVEGGGGGRATAAAMSLGHAQCCNNVGTLDAMRARIGSNMEYFRLLAGCEEAKSWTTVFRVRGQILAFGGPQARPLPN